MKHEYKLRLIDVCEKKSANVQNLASIKTKGYIFDSKYFIN